MVAHNGGSAWCKQSVALRLRDTRAVLIDNAKGKDRELTRLAAADDKPAAKPKGKKPAYKTLAVKPGPCVIRLQKKGSALTLSACFGYTGEFTPDVTATMTSSISAKPSAGRSRRIRQRARPWRESASRS